MKQAVWIFSKL